MKEKNHIYIYLYLLLFAFWFYILPVNAEVYNYVEKCSGSEYQCIACEYEATNVNKSQHVVFYAKSNGDGTVDLTNETFAEINGKKNFNRVIKWTISTEGSKFISSDGSKLTCPPVYMKDDGAGNLEKISVYFGNNDKTQSTLLDSNDNGKPFLESGVDLEEATCPNIPIYIVGAGVVAPGFKKNFSSRNYMTTTNTGTIIKGDNPHLELPANHIDVTNWDAFTDFSKIDECNKKMIIACSEQTITTYQAAYTERTCYLTTTQELSGRTHVDADKKPTGDDIDISTPEFPNSGSDPGNNFDVTPLSVCASSSFRKPMRFVGWIIRTLKYLIPLIIIGFGILDVYRSITNSDAEKGTKTAIKGFAIRVLAGVAIFLLPGILEFILGMVNTWNSGNNNYNYSASWACCGECALDANCDVTGNTTKYCK